MKLRSRSWWGTTLVDVEPPCGLDPGGALSDRADPSYERVLLGLLVGAPLPVWDSGATAEWRPEGEGTQRVFPAGGEARRALLAVLASLALFALGVALGFALSTLH